MSKIVREQVEEIEMDGEDYAIALENLKEKYGNDKDIETIVRMCNQWQDSFHKAESRYNSLVAEVTKFQIKAVLIGRKRRKGKRKSSRRKKSKKTCKITLN